MKSYVRIYCDGACPCRVDLCTDSKYVQQAFVRNRLGRRASGSRARCSKRRADVQRRITQRLGSGVPVEAGKERRRVGRVEGG